MNIDWKFNGTSIEVKCPRCGRWGKLISKGRKCLGGVKLAIKHESERNVSIETCSIGVCSDYYPKLLKIYEECRKVRERERRRRKRIIHLQL